MKPSFSGPVLASVFLLTLVAELLVLTSWAGKPSLALSPIIWLLLGILNAWTGSVLISRYSAGVQGYHSRMASLDSYKTFVALLAFGIGVFYAGSMLYKVYQEIPQFSNMSDIIPGKREFIRRFLHGETVYVPVQFDSYALQPTFLPFRWLPFVIADLWQFDYRWMTYAGFTAGVGFWVFSGTTVHAKSSYWEIIVKALFPFVALGGFINFEKLNFALAVELLILGYHLILARFVFHKNPWVVGFSLVLCLLSRYSIFLWLLVPAYWLILEKRYVFLAKIFLITIAGIFLFYYLPFCRHDGGQHFLDASKYYVDACFGCWHTDSWLPPGAVPNTLSKGSGFQYLIYQYGPADLATRYKLNMNLGLITCAASIVVTCFLLRRQIKSQNDPVAIQGLLLASLKVYMIFFIGFIMCPFNYLFIVPFFMSMPLLFSIPFKSAFKDQKRPV